MTWHVLDLFCGAGGSAMGLYRGFIERYPGLLIVGVDNRMQPHYPAFHDAPYAKHFAFVQGDALTYPLDGFDFIWASPPCQAYSRTKTLAAKDYPKLIDGIRSRLRHYKIPYVIENVPGAPLRNPTLLCGTMFGLKTYRHRLFETSFQMPLVMHPGHGIKQDPMRGPSSNRKAPMVVVAGHYSYHGEAELRKQAMGIDWMNRDELAQAIPPAYSFYIARQIRAFVPECRP